MAQQQTTNLAPVPDGSALTDPSLKSGSNLTKPWLIWLRQLWTSVNRAPQIVSIPAGSAAPGTPGQTAFDANFAYFCVAKDSWKRAALVSF